MVKITRYLSPDGESFMGGAFDNFGTPNGGQAGQGGGTPPAAGTPPATPPDAATIEADQTLMESLVAKDEATLTAEEKTQLEALKAKYVVEELKEDGTPLTAEEKAAKATVAKRIADITAKPEGQRTVEEVKFLQENTKKAVSVYEEVDELSGVSIDVDYGTDAPTSPQGILKREEAIRAQAQTAQLGEIKESYPLAYQFLLHLQAGGNPENFLNTNTDDYQSIVLVKEDKATQENIYRKALAIKGNTEEQIDALVQIAKDKNKLYDQSKVELEKLQRQQVIEEKQREVVAKQKKQADEQASTTFYTTLNTMLEKGVNGVLIPKEDRKAFSTFLTENTFVRDGKLIYYKELDPKNLGEEVAANYFKFKKGDLSKVIQRKAASIVANEKREAIKIKLVPRTSQNTVPKLVPMSQI